MDIRDAIKANNTAIEAIDLVKDYGSGSNAVHALRDVNIAFEQGKFTVIMGPSRWPDLIRPLADTSCSTARI